MGGGASAVMNLDDLIQTTVMIGRAVAAITFPGMYRIYDFHSPRAPRLKSARHFVLFSEDSEEDEEGGGGPRAPDPFEYEHFFSVDVNGETVYIENVLLRNEQNWNALHTCCMSYVTVAAGLKLLQEMVRLGGSLEEKTELGPGTFNKKWTALHMASAYGIEPLVKALLDAGADPNCTNSFGYTPLLEACHRGFVSIVALLLKSERRIQLDYIPSEDVAESSPFMAAPSHSALGEAARCGFVTIVQSLLEAGAPLDQKNSLGWTPLHEACFYNRAEVVKALLAAGASASIRTRTGALPYHLSGLQSIRSQLQDLGGPGSVPEEGDTIDMMQVLHELTSSAASSALSFGGGGGGGGGAGGHLQFHFGLDDEDDEDEDDDEDGEGEGDDDEFGDYDEEEEERQLRRELAELAAELGQAKEAEAERREAEERRAARKARKAKRAAEHGAKDELLHSGRLLGDLPSLSRGTPGGGGVSSALGEALENPERLSPDFQADGKGKGKGKGKGAGGRAGKGKGKKRGPEVPADMPAEFLCQLSRRPMSDPVQSVYGSVFDRTTILQWFREQGHICPLSGAPLAESDLKTMDELGQRIRRWILNKSLGKQQGGDEGERGGDGGGEASGGLRVLGSGAEAKSASPGPGLDSKASAAAAAAANDDLYDF